MSTRTRPDLAYAVSATAQVLTKDLELRKVKLRHLLQELKPTKTKRLFCFAVADQGQTSQAQCPGNLLTSKSG